MCLCFAGVGGLLAFHVFLAQYQVRTVAGHAESPAVLAICTKSMHLGDLVTMDGIE
jgi:hypothetical protein